MIKIVSVVLEIIEHRSKSTGKVLLCHFGQLFVKTRKKTKTTLQLDSEFGKNVGKTEITFGWKFYVHIKQETFRFSMKPSMKGIERVV